jgi:nitrogen fixation protein
MKRSTIGLVLVMVLVVALGMLVAAQDATEPAAPLAQARLAVAHLAPFAMDPGTAVSIEVNGVEVLNNFEFAGSTGYLPLEAGVDHLIEVFPAGSATAAISATVNLDEGMDYTALAIGGANGWDLELKLLEDDNAAPAAGTAKVRVGHLAPFAADVADTLADVRLQDGTVILNDVPYGAVAGYLELPAGTYDLKITTADGSATLIDLMPVALSAGDIVSVFAVGDGVNQPVGAFALPSGAAGSLLPLAAYVQIAHLAPFAMDPGTAVSVEVNGVQVLSNFEFAGSTGYLLLEAGVDHLIEVFPAGSATAAISATVNLDQGMDYTALAIGGANGWDLELKLLEDDNAAPAAGTAKVRIGHLAPFAADVADTLADVRLQDGTVILDDVPYGAITDYLELPAGIYDLKITTPDGSVTLIDLMPVALSAGDIVSVFAVGDGVNQPVGAFALPSGAAGSLLPLAAYVQIAHLAPFAMDPDTAVSVEVNGVQVLSNFEFAGSTGYLPLEAGVDHLIEVFPAGSATAAISATVNLDQGMEFTALAIGGANGWDLELKLLEDDNAAPAAGTAKVRIGHLAPFAADVADTLADVRLQDGTVILDDVPYGAITDYLELPAGIYDLKITTPDGSVTLIDPMPVALSAGDIVSVFAVGDAVNQPVGAFALPSGAAGSLLLPAAYVQIAHLAPFAMDPDTAVTVKLNGTTVLMDFAFADSTPYLPLQAGVDHLIEVFPAGSATAAISATVNLDEGMDYTALAIGGANGWDLELKLLEDDNAAPAAGTAKVRIGHLAPFAADVADTLADVRLQDGTVILNDVPYGAITDYLELPAGIYDLKITTPDGSVTLIDPLPLTLGDGDILSAFAVGDAGNQPAALFVLPSGRPGFLAPETYFYYLPMIFINSTY